MDFLYIAFPKYFAQEELAFLMLARNTFAMKRG
jgi:hypothetical protein